VGKCNGSCGGLTLSDPAAVVATSDKSPFRQQCDDNTPRCSSGSDLDNCKVSGFHSADYEESLLLGCYAVWLL
jgi:hypothetical protein